jgi:hypothetical protein
MTKKYVTADGTVVRGIPQLEETGISLLRAIWEEIKADQSAWNQGAWIGLAPRSGIYFNYELDPAVKAFIKDNAQVPWDCGTACCLAGHAVMAKGYQLAPNGHNVVKINDFVLPPDTSKLSAESGEVQSEYIPNVARRLLGLDEQSSTYLFGSDRKPFEIEQMVNALEVDPSANLERVLESVNPSEAREWERRHGFRDSLNQPTYGHLDSLDIYYSQE